MNKPIAALGTVVLLACGQYGCSCIGTGNADEIESHFGAMHYTQAIPAEDIGRLTSGTVDLGAGEYEDANGMQKDYKWVVLTRDDEQRIGGLLLGTSEVGAKNVAMMTRGETRDALKVCADQHPDNLELRWLCYDDVVSSVIFDCEIVTDSSAPDCRDQCWYDVSKCD